MCINDEGIWAKMQLGGCIGQAFRGVARVVDDVIEDVDHDEEGSLILY